MSDETIAHEDKIRRQRQETLYWQTVRATLETVFKEDPAQLDQLERAYREGSSMDRAVLYNMEPLDLAAEVLDVTPTEAQRAEYMAMVQGLMASAPAPGPKRVRVRAGRRMKGRLHARTEQQVPAVAIEKSVTPDYIVCLEDGTKLKLLKRHLRATYDMTPEDYRAKWGLPADYPMVAPNYSKKRAQMARQLGLAGSGKKQVSQG